MMQPPGGVTKVIPFGAMQAVLKGFDPQPTDENKYKDGDQGDLRITIPGRKLCAFVRWWQSREGREILPTREFEEELVETGILLHVLFPSPNFHRYDSKITGPRLANFYPHTKREILLHEFFELSDLSAGQQEAIQELVEGQDWPTMSKEAIFGWYSVQEIGSGGAVSEKNQVWSIASHASWMMGLERN